jgi:hypothetical protein
MNLELILAVVSLLVSCGVGILHLVAPLTKTTVDDEWLARLEAVEKLLAGVPTTPPEAPKAG